MTHVAVAFDNPIRSVRNDWYDGYKTDEGVPADCSRSSIPPKRRCGARVWSSGR